MANVRIKDLTTTAATTASDDFFGVDGATNGTRKLNAYSPTFGGNLTVSGGTITGGTSGLSLAAGGSVQNITITPSGGAKTVIRGSDGGSGTKLVEFAVEGGSVVASINGVGHLTVPVLLGGGSGISLRSNAVAQPILFEQTSLVEVGRFAATTGNLLIGTTTDGGQKLQVSGTAAISGGIVGTTTNNSAAAGIVGEFVSSAVVSGSAVSLTNATAANITSISLTAGDWDVTGLVQYNFTGATCSYVYHGFSSASAVFGAPNSYVQDYRNYTTASVSTHNPSLTFRISLAATTTIYFVTQADFSAGTVGAYGRIQARRVR